MTEPQIFLVGEDELCAGLAHALVLQSGAKARVENYKVAGGYGPFRNDIEKMNRVAEKVMPVLMLADADQAPCPVTQRNALLPKHPSNRLALRLAVREAEAWVLADHEGFAEFAQVSRTRLPALPEQLNDPKSQLLSIIAKCKRRDLRTEMLPGKYDQSPVGLGYNVHLRDFVSNYWDSARAALRAPSLARALPRVAALLGAT